ncbi:phosphotransferase family protein, partial [Novosphingobium malaysiense]
MQPVTSRTDSKLADWITANAGLHDVEIGDLLAGGNANVTRLVTAREGRFVLRHPPVNALSDKAAAGISREYTAISALYGEAPVARP